MTYYVACLSSILAAYLIGAIPFGFLIARWARGVDIRTVGSGNIGATNVGRVLGFRFFVVVFVLDLLKGFGPTLGFPMLVGAATGQPAGWLAVPVALAAILGHNFPVYLGFKGGKGVATSLGAVAALDPVAALAAAVGFVGSLLATRFVSVSSVVGGLAFTAVHFARTPKPWSREQIAMSVVTLVLLVLLVVRHRKNFARLRAGTEPRVALGRSRRTGAPSGCISRVLLVVLAVVAVAGVLVARRVSERPELRVGGCTLAEVTRVATGYQRAERVAFADGGKLLAVTCPRYRRLVLYRVTAGESLAIQGDVELGGRPVALATAGDRLYVLQRPPGDAKHLEPGYWEAFDFEGRRVGARRPVGLYPDDMAVSPDGRFAFVLTSGRAEGGADKPAPALGVFEIEDGSETPREVGRVAFGRPDDDPDRLALSADGRRAVVAFRGVGQGASSSPIATTTLDLSDPSHPILIGGTVAGDDFPNPILPDGDGDAARVDLPAAGACLARTRVGVSGLELVDAPTSRTLGRLPIRGAWNLAPTRLTGVAWAAGRGLIAVANRSGGVHLVAVRPDRGQSDVAASLPDSGARRR